MLSVQEAADPTVRLSLGMAACGPHPSAYGCKMGYVGKAILREDHRGMCGLMGSRGCQSGAMGDPPSVPPLPAALPPWGFGGQLVSLS